MSGASPIGRFPAAQRVRRRTEFKAATTHGRRVVTPHFVLLIYARHVTAPEAGPARLGIIASRKVGHAVRRNRAKRLVREAFRATRDLWMPGIDLVVIVRSALVNMNLDDVVGEWRTESSSIGRRSRQARADAHHRAEGA